MVVPLSLFSSCDLIAVTDPVQIELRRDLTLNLRTMSDFLFGFSIMIVRQIQLLFVVIGLLSGRGLRRSCCCSPREITIVRPWLDRDMTVN